MTATYRDWTKARVAAELRARGLPAAGSSQALRKRLRHDDEQRASGHDHDEHPPDDDASAQAALPEDDPDEAPPAAGSVDEAPVDEAPVDEDTVSERRSGSVPPARVARNVVAELRAITGRDVDGMAALTVRPHGGWGARLVVVDVARVPPSDDLMVAYDVEFDARGHIRSCTRAGRYVRGRMRRRARLA